MSVKRSSFPKRLCSAVPVIRDSLCEIETKKKKKKKKKGKSEPSQGSGIWALHSKLCSPAVKIVAVIVQAPTVVANWLDSKLMGLRMNLYRWQTF